MKKSILIKIFGLIFISTLCLQSCGSFNNNPQREVGRQQNQNSTIRNNTSRNDSNRGSNSNNSRENNTSNRNNSNRNTEQKSETRTSEEREIK